MRRAWLSAVAALALWASPARAQGLLKVEFTPWAGVYVPATDLVEEEAGVAAPVTVSTSLAFGANLGLRLPMGLAIEGQVGYAPAEIEYDLGPGPQTEDLNILFAAANLQWRFGPPLVPVKPYLTAGVGMVRWESDALASESTTNVAGNLGAGAYISLGPIVSLRVDGRAYVTTFSAQDFDPGTADESKFQSHFVASGGLVLGFGI